MTTYLRRIVNLEQCDYWTIQRAAREKGLGDKGFSAALRLIVREWDSYRKLMSDLIPVTDAEPNVTISTPE